MAHGPQSSALSPQSFSQNWLAVAPIRPLVTPLWLGAERTGVEAGAATLARLLGVRWDRPDRAALTARLREPVLIPAPVPDDAANRLGRGWRTFLPEIGITTVALAAAVREAITAGELAVALGGDHAVAIGSIAGAAASAERLGLLWIDTHPDLNTPETSPSGHVHGMPLAIALGGGPSELAAMRGDAPPVRAEDVCLLGVRDIDAGEGRFIAERGIWALTMEEWTDRGILPGLHDALDHLTARGVDAVHLSFDLDVLDPTVLSGTGTRYPGGLTMREASQLLRHLGAWDGPIRSLDWVELNPTLDPTSTSEDVATQLLATALGERMRAS
ncbi:MAG: arginase [Chloroflexia bacterium]|nr:arginase [Chloroflexia bacterium]